MTVSERIPDFTSSIQVFHKFVFCMRDMLEDESTKGVIVELPDVVALGVVSYYWLEVGAI